MTSKKQWNRLSKRFLNDHESLWGTTDFSMNGYNFKVFSGVFSPSISSDTEWFANQLLPILKGKNFLEIGAGTGVIACLAKLYGAKKVSATDINPIAVNNINANARLHNLQIDIFRGNVFDPLPEGTKFDIIFWNHPFNYTEEKEDVNDKLSLSVFDLKYSSLKKYLREAKKRLNDNGLLLLGTGNIARINLIKKFSLDYGYKMLLLNKLRVNLSSKNTTMMDVRLYSFIKT